MNLKEDMFAQLYNAGAIKAVRVELHRGYAVVAFELVADGAKGVIQTKRGEVKQYRVETALRTLWAIGLEDVVVNMAGWDA